MICRHLRDSHKIAVVPPPHLQIASPVFKMAFSVLEIAFTPRSESIEIASHP